MDTGDLSEEAYLAIMIEAERFNHDLTLQFGLLSYHCKDEDDFIEKAVSLILEMKKFDKFEIDDMFFGNPPQKAEFHKTLAKILKNIVEVKKIPAKKRNYD